MIKVLIILILVMFNCAIVLTICKIKRSKKMCTYKTPKLSSLSEKEFSKYIDNLTKDLY